MHPFPETHDKREWRVWAKTQRSALDIPKAPLDILPRLIQLDEWKKARWVLLYSATPAEISVNGLLSDRTQKEWCFPRCLAGKQLAIHRVFSGQLRDWLPNRYGIREPDPDSPLVAPETLDLVIVPALAFDEHGNRLGQGGGYYDRFLPKLRPDCVTIGIAPDALVVPNLPAEPHDISVQVLVTEKRTIRRADTIAPTPRPY